MLPDLARRRRAREAGQRVLDALAADDAPEARAVGRPGPDPPARRPGERFAEAIGAPEPEVIENASHFLQEDEGEAIGRRIAGWLR